MKKAIALLLTLVMALTIVVSAIPAFAAETVLPNENWDADEEGVYKISTPADLLAFASFAPIYGYYDDATVVLTNDIDMAGIEWFHCAEFHGEFNGNGYAIKNLTMNGTWFIRKIMNGAVVKNLRMLNVKSSGNGDTAVLALSVTNNATFENVYVQGSVTVPATGARASGFISMTNQGTAEVPSVITFTNCVSEVTVTGQRASGFLAQTYPFTKVVFNDCVFLGDLSGASDYSSNFTGLTVSGDIEMNRCVSLGKSQAGEKAGVFVFLDHQNNPEPCNNGVVSHITLNDCYAAVDGQHAIGAHTKRSYHHELTIKYGGVTAYTYKAESEEANVLSVIAEVDASMKYAADAEGVKLTKDNFKTNYTALSAEDKWVVCGDETVAYCADKTVAKILPAVAKDLIDGKSTVDVTPNEPSGGDASGDGSTDNTDGSTDNTDDTQNDDTAATETETAAATESDTEAETEAEEKGCGGVIGAGAVVVMAITGAAVAVARKKED